MAGPAKAKASEADPGERVCLGVVAGAHGVHGVVRIKSFTERPADIGAYGPLSDESGRRRFEIEVQGMHKGAVLATVAGVEDRDAALALKGTRLFVARQALPPLDDADTFYHADLIGIPVEDRAGRRLGRVVAVADYGAGDVLELVDEKGGERALPFTRAVVPVVDLAGGRIVADPPAETEAGGRDRPEDDDPAP